MRYLLQMAKYVAFGVVSCCVTGRRVTSEIRCSEILHLASYVYSVCDALEELAGWPRTSRRGTCAASHRCGYAYAQ